MDDLRTVVIDAVKGKITGNYSAGQTSEAIRAALIELNGGSNKINPKTFYKGNALYELVQDVIPVMIDEGLKADNPLFKLVDYRNISQGDLNEFVTEVAANFVVADAAAGIAGVRRQRIGEGEAVAVKTTMKTVRVYENLGRLLAGRITFDQFVDGVAKAFNHQILADAYAALDGITSATAGLNAEYVKSGTFSEATLLELVEHVEAATGKTAKIYGTKTALRKIATANISDQAKEDMYALGYYGKFNGTDMISLKQVHKPGTDTFALSASKVVVLAGSDQPIKMVNEGTGLLIAKDPTSNADLTQEYIYGQLYGTGVICAEKMGIYLIS